LPDKIQSRSHSILGDFYTELEKKDSSNYVSESLGVIQTSLDRYLKSQGYKVLIIRGREFGKSNKITFGTKARKHVQTQQTHLSGKKKKCCGKRADLSNGQNLVFADPTLTGRQENYDIRVELFKFTKDENGRTYVAFAA